MGLKFPKGERLFRKGKLYFYLFYRLHEILRKLKTANLFVKDLNDAKRGHRKWNSENLLIVTQTNLPFLILPIQTMSHKSSTDGYKAANFLETLK